MLSGSAFLSDVACVLTLFIISSCNINTSLIPLLYCLYCTCSVSGVARICCEEGQKVKLCHGALTADFRAGCSRCSITNSFVTNAVLIERAVSC